MTLQTLATDAGPTYLYVAVRLFCDNQSRLHPGWSRLCDQTENPAAAGFSFGFDP